MPETLTATNNITSEGGFEMPFSLGKSVSLERSIDFLKQTPFFYDQLYLLPKTGFLVSAQTEKLPKLLLNSPESSQNVGETWIQKATKDIQDYCVEYVMKKTYLPIDAGFKIINGKRRLVSSDEYENSILVDLINSNERNGIVRESVMELEKLLNEESEGTIIVRTSPMGWNGYTNSYQDTQTQVYYKQNGQIFAFGLRTKMSPVQSEELLMQLGTPLLGNREDMDQHKRICEITGINAVSKLQPQDIIRLVQQISGNTDANGNTFDQIWQDFSSRVSYKRFPVKIQSNINQFQEYVRKQFELYQTESSQFSMDQLVMNLKMAIAVTLLQIIKPEVDFDIAYRTDNQKLFSQSMDNFYPKQIFHSFTDALTDMQKLGGCAGGGSSDNPLEDSLAFIKTAFGWRSITGEDKYGSLHFTCPVCHQEHWREKNKIMIDCPNKRDVNGKPIPIPKC